MSEVNKPSAVTSYSYSIVLILNMNNFKYFTLDISFFNM